MIRPAYIYLDSTTDFTAAIYTLELAETIHLQTLHFCSQRTLILEVAAERLQVKKVGLEVLAFSTISGTQQDKEHKLV